MFQFSLRNLLFAVAFFACGAAALVNANGWWVAITWGAALFSITSAALLTVYRRDEKRAFWSGYVLFGSLHVLLLLYSIQPVSSSNSSVLCWAPLSYFSLLTTKLANWSYSHLPASLATEYLPGVAPSSSGSSSSGSLGMDTTYGSAGSGGAPMSGTMPVGPMSGFGGMPGMPGGPPPAPNPRFVDQTTYLEVSHALWTILLATLGGVLSCWIYKTSQPPRL